MTDKAISRQKRLPDPEICRTIYLGKSLGFTECLVKNSDRCKLAVRFATCVCCYHPHRRSFEKKGLP